MKEEQRLRVSIGIYKNELSEFNDMACEIIEKAERSDVSYLVDKKISRMPEFCDFAEDLYSGHSDCQFSDQHCEKRLGQIVKIVKGIMPDPIYSNADDYVEGLKSWSDSETSFRNELRLDYQANVL